MIKYILSVAALSLVFTPLNVLASKGGAKNSIEARYAYTMGYRIGQMLKAQGMDKLDNRNFIDGLDDFFAGNEPRLDEIEMTDAVNSYQQYMQSQRKNDAQANLAESQAFLTQNKSREGVMEMPSGLQYQVITPSAGIQPGTNDAVEIHYHGTLLNGDIFDSSVKRGKPARFMLDQVIPGFSEALINMHVGEKWRIYVPPALGYGEKGVKGSIGPNEILIFDIELLSVKGND